VEIARRLEEEDAQGMDVGLGSNAIKLRRAQRILLHHQGVVAQFAELQQDGEIHARAGVNRIPRTLKKLVEEGHEIPASQLLPYQLGNAERRHVRSNCGLRKAIHPVTFHSALGC
jgi:UDP-N-acetylenolpyruvoylglucosamine reductase